MLAVPDAEYASWVIRLDLYRIAMFGLEGAEPLGAGGAKADQEPTQRDEVRVNLRNKKLIRRGSE